MLKSYHIDLIKKLIGRRLYVWIEPKFVQFEYIPNEQGLLMQTVLGDIREDELQRD